MQAPAKSTHRRSLKVPARLPERMPVPVLGLELAARQHPGPQPGADADAHARAAAARRPHPGPYPAPGAYPSPGTYPGPGPYPGAGAGQVVASRGRRALMLAVCCMSLFMVGLDNTIVNVGLPDIGRDLHAGVSGLQWTVAAYTVVLAALLMFAGALADRIGRRTIFQVGLSLFTLGSWMCSLAPGLGWLIGFRILQGVGGSMLNPAALGIITNTFTGRAERARAIGVWDGVFGLSMALGPVLGGVLVGTVGWRGIFWANIPVGLAAVSLTALFVPDSRAPRSRRADPVGQFLIIVMLGSLAYAIAAMAGFLFLSTLYLQDVRGLSALQAGLAILPMPVVMALCAPLAGRMVAKRGPRIPLVIAGAALTISSAALSRLTGTTEHAYLIVTYALFGIGAGMVSSPITNGVMSGVPKTQAGMASGMNSSSRQLGQSLGVAIVGSVLAASF